MWVCRFAVMLREKTDLCRYALVRLLKSEAHFYVFESIALIVSGGLLCSHGAIHTGGAGIFRCSHAGRRGRTYGCDLFFLFSRLLLRPVRSFWCQRKAFTPFPAFSVYMYLEIYLTDAFLSPGSDRNVQVSAPLAGHTYMSVH